MLLTVNDPVQDSYDVVVIGSGLGGLTAANTLAKNGRKVLLLEAHNKLGGLATWFFRKNREYIFDVSLHGFPAGMIKTCRKYWSKEIADSIVQLTDVRFKNPQFELQTPFTREHFTELLQTKFGIQKSVIEDFFNYVEAMNFYDQNPMTNRELFDKFFPNRNDVVRLLMEPITYANGSTLDDPAITYGIVFSNFMSKGVYTFVGGTDQLIFKMRDELVKNGVDIKMQSKIEKINVEPVGGKPTVTGVYVKDKLVKCKAVVSNGNIINTIFKMVGEEHFTPEFAAKAKAVRLNSSSSQVYMALRAGEKIDHVGDLIFTSTHPTYDPEKILAHQITSRTFSVYYPETRPHDPIPKYTIVSSTNSHYADWISLSEEAYAAEKKKMIDETLDALEKIIPGVKEKIDFVDAATPCTVEWYTHHKNGASFGTKFEGLDVSMNLAKEVTGLYHAGSVGIIMSGWLGASNYGVIKANEVDSYLFKLENHELGETHV